MIRTGRFSPSGLLLVLLLVLGAAGPVRAAGVCLWQVDGPQARLWLLGSLHVLPPSALPLPEPMQQAYADSDLLVTEADIGQLQSPEGQALLLQRGSYRGERSLPDDLGPALHARVREVAQRQGLPMSLVNGWQPWMVSAVLSINEMGRYGLFPQFGVDLHFHVRAVSDNKPRLALESLAEHAEVLAGMPMAAQVQFLRLGLDDLARGRELVDALLGSWSRCDEAAIDRLLKDSLQSQPQVAERLLAARNRRWLPQLEALLAGERNALVVVGAGHLVGEDSVVALLRARGHEVRRAPAPAAADEQG